ncbi:hypothetical protein [Microbispora hainanensis]|uniref:hypothetical protein n=1 Tax=Microbispora hainanensis TaxID=568844 RepID=UPI00324CB12E
MSATGARPAAARWALSAAPTVSFQRRASSAHSARLPAASSTGARPQPELPQRHGQRRHRLDVAPRPDRGQQHAHMYPLVMVWLTVWRVAVWRVAVWRVAVWRVGELPGSQRGGARACPARSVAGRGPARLTAPDCPP